MSRYRIKRKKCINQLNDIIRDLSDRYGDQYLNGILLKDILMENGYIETMDDYLSKNAKSNVIMPFLGLLLTGAIRNDEQEAKEVYNRDYDINVKTMKCGYVMMFMTGSYGYISWEPHRGYEIDHFAVMRLENGEMYEITQFGEVKQIAEIDIISHLHHYGDIFEDESKRFLIGSSWPLKYHNIEDYIQFFRTLYDALNLDEVDDCPEFIELVLEFVSKLDENFEKYTEFVDEDMMSMIMDIVSGQTTERGKLSKFRRTTAESFSMSIYEKKQVEPTVLDDVIENIIDVVSSSDLIETYEIYADVLDKLLGKIFQISVGSAEDVIIISSLIKWLNDYFIINRGKDIPKILKNLLKSGFTRKPSMSFKNSLRGIQRNRDPSDIDIHFLIISRFILYIFTGSYSFDGYFLELSDPKYIKYYSDILFMWDIISPESTLVSNEIVQNFDLNEQINQQNQQQVQQNPNVPQNHDIIKYKRVVDLVITFIILHVNNNKDDPMFPRDNGSYRDLFFYLFDILNTFVLPTIDPHDIIDEMSLYIRTQLTERLEEEGILRYMYLSEFEPIEALRVIDKSLHPYNIEMNKIINILEEEKQKILTENRSNLQIAVDWDKIYFIVYPEEVYDKFYTEYRGTEIRKILVYSESTDTYYVDNMHILSLQDYYKNKINLFQHSAIICDFYADIRKKEEYNNPGWGEFDYLIDKLLIVNISGTNFWLMLDIILEIQGYDNLNRFVDNMMDLTIHYLQNHNNYTKHKSNKCVLLYTFDLDEYIEYGNNYMVIYGEATVRYILGILKYILDNFDNLVLTTEYIENMVRIFGDVIARSMISIYFKTHPESSLEQYKIYRDLESKVMARLE